ncbi:cytochrome o ubiquinol oxidase subunit IV [Cohnella thailandensis]|jgi:Heme/copper-type cytochrome/quinol oxidase, subunit 4|uniref:Cytochrome C oxidase subunit IV family protein n=1 Tax=Cohnella thailandensis TaxID=557557 RepID=A0A841SYP3_9BACL|nr:cytochrome C oxidase subunit IV family protein [Cohnella thailandensis]MBB6637333.1 cytochrome C oxidase subunit IV family protein [Cohnella thailandensis]MBP1976661.1 cytochrome c oxidase subunit 4 [Cohnella thailandensis]
MSSNQSTHEETRRHREEGPKKHIVAFVLSLVLTLIAFAAVASGEINTTFTYVILVGMAIVQVFVQLSFWMHMKDRGHLFPILGIVFGAVVVFTMVIMAEYWVWW